MATPLGPVHKTVSLSHEGQVRIRFELQWERMPLGSLRLGHVTLNPEAFDAGSLFFETHNGGSLPDRFFLNQPDSEKHSVEHGRSVSFLVSSSSALGMTGGELRMGDRERAIIVRTRLDQACVVGQITYLPVQGSFFYRVSFSAEELDETSRERERGDLPKTLEFEICAESCSRN